MANIVISSKKYANRVNYSLNQSLSCPLISNTMENVYPVLSESKQSLHSFVVILN